MADSNASAMDSERKHAVMDYKVFGHPAGLFVLFFTEMWERFSFYGMRVLLINFLTMAIIGINPGWEWSIENATALYGTYAALLYLTPIIGGMIADKYWGYRKSVSVGILIMVLGHISMAVETETSLYLGLALLVIGTGFFKPNMTSIISKMYVYLPQKEDSAYTLYYMGVNAGAFFGMMLCGYLGERVGWSYGFGLAAVFLFLGYLQFIAAKKIFGGIGDPPKKEARRKSKITDTSKNKEPNKKEAKEKTNPFSITDIILIIVTSLIGLLYIFNEPSAVIGDIHLLPEKFIFSPDTISGSNVLIITAIVLFFFLMVKRIVQYDKVVRDRMIALVIFAFFTVIFFGAFEQAATSMITFARDFTQRALTGTAAIVFNIINTLLTVVPLIVVTWVVFVLYKKSHARIGKSNAVLIFIFVLMWGLVGWMLYQDYTSKSYKVSYQAVAVEESGDSEHPELLYEPITEARPLQPGETAVTRTMEVNSNDDLEVGQKIEAHEEAGKFRYLKADQEERLIKDFERLGQPSNLVHGEVVSVLDREVEITVSWFSILNSFFIIVFSSLFSKWWESKYNPSAAVKYGLGLILMGIGFALLAYGARVIPVGAAPGMVRVGIIWLILLYLFNTLGELCLSPVGLSYVSKLVPPRMIAFMFGMWYLAIAIGNYIAAKMGGMSEQIQQNHGMATFFLIFALIPIGVGLIAILLNRVLKRLMHGVR